MRKRGRKEREKEREKRREKREKVSQLGSKTNFFRFLFLRPEGATSASDGIICFYVHVSLLCKEHYQCGLEKLNMESEFRNLKPKIRILLLLINNLLFVCFFAFLCFVVFKGAAGTIKCLFSRVTSECKL